MVNLSLSEWTIKDGENDEEIYRAYDALRKRPFAQGVIYRRPPGDDTLFESEVTREKLLEKVFLEAHHILDVSGIDGFCAVCEAVGKIGQRDGGIAYELFNSSTKMLERLTVPLYQELASITDIMMDKNPDSARAFAQSADNISLDITNAGWVYVPHAIEQIKTVAKEIPQIAVTIAMYTGHVLKVYDGIYYEAFVQKISELAKKHLTLASDLAEVSYNVLDNYKYDMQTYFCIIDAIGKVAGKDEKKASELTQRWHEIFKRMGQPHNEPDLFLIASIKDMKDAQTIRPLLDMEKYGKEYAKRVARFY